jgi:hypothetical protein
MTALLPAVCPGLAVGVLVACIALAARATWRRTHRPVTPAVNRDVLAPPGPLYGARRLPVRPVPPVVAPPPDARHYQQVAGIWGPDILEIPHTVREYPYVDWQARIQERRN